MSWPESWRRWALAHAFRQPLPTLAAFCVVQNEELFLREFLLYHRALGVAQFYIFLDRSTDRSEEICREFPWVKVVHLARDPETSQWNISHQLVCSQEALKLARQDAMEWLMHIDPDEFAVGENTLPRSALGRLLPNIGLGSALILRSYLPAMLAALPPETEQVIMRTKEVAPVEDLASKNGFWEHTFFQQRPAIRREIWDPVEQKMVLLERYLGHPQGKSIVRTAAAVQAFDSHAWTREQGLDKPERIAIPTAACGFHYHYVVISSGHWRQKYLKAFHEPDHWARGAQMDFPRRSWKHACAMLSEEEARAYFVEWVCLSPSGREEAIREGLLQQETTVRDLLREIGALA